ncbi:MAG: FAD-dependent oxidoreductase, partial [Chloroflexi bacterium]|nr:FAD-dependent oxidoreductase [Chloroflexota bacterium]
MKTIHEPAREVPVLRETDVLVVGGGPAGLAAAVAAARLGTRVCLVERYGYLGGLATGGLVIYFPGYRPDGSPTYRGIALEWVRR